MIDSLWTRALSHPIGIAVTTNDRTLLRQQLYRARPSEDFSIAFPEKEDELWIVRRVR